MDIVPMAELDLTTEDGILAYLQNNKFPFCPNVVKAERLPEGFGGFVYRIQIEGADITSVIVKHAEGYAARAPSWKLDQSRMLYESKAMSFLAQSEMQSSNTVRIPKLLHYDEHNHILIMEDAGRLPSLKGWLQTGVDPDVAAAIGEALGTYLATLHNLTAGNTEILANFNGNATGKYLSGTLYFGMLPAAAEKFGYSEPYLQDVAEAGLKEVNEASEVLTLGDFWTGNVLVDLKEAGAFQLYVLDLELAKPGTAAFDIGQMAAEMYCLAAFRDHRCGSALLDGFLKAYKENRTGVVDAAKVAIRIGAHLVVMMPNAWRNEASHGQIEEVVKLGVDLIRNGWETDETRLRGSIVGSLI